MHDFLPMGTGGSTLQRTIGLNAPPPWALGKPAHASFHMSWTSLYEIAPLRTLLKKYVDFKRRPITFPCSNENRCGPYGGSVAKGKISSSETANVSSAAPDGQPLVRTARSHPAWRCTKAWWPLPFCNISRR